MKDSPLPSSPAWAAYSNFLWEQWPKRTQRAARTALVGSVLLLLSDALSVGFGSAPELPRLLSVIAARLVCLLVPVCLLGAMKHFPAWHAGPRVGVTFAGAWLVLSQAAFYFAGTQRSVPHAALLVWSLFFMPLVLPLRAQARGLFYGFLVASYAVLELTLDPGYPLAQRLLGIAMLGGVAGGIAWSLERVLHGLRGHFFLKQEMVTTVRALEESHLRVGEAAETIGELVEKLRDSTLELSSESSRARSETARIATASERVATMARAASERAAGAGSIVSQATGHTQRIDEEMNRVESGVNGIGQAIWDTESSLEALATSARQIVEFTQTLQEFANQTDVLALNAAMEAARAGDAGRSFSVVAREVRRLAEASKDSSVKIHEVMQGTRTQLESALQGMAALRANTRQFESSFTDARKTLEAIRQIVTQIEKLMGSTVVDAQEQAGATGNISAGAAQLQRLLDSHAQMSQDVAITADRLGQLAEALRDMLPKKDPAPAVPAPQPLAPPAAPLPSRPVVA